MPNPDTPDQKRRLYLRVLIKLLSALAILLLLWPFVATLYTTEANDPQENLWQGPFPLTGVLPGQLKIIPLARPPGEVWVYRRLPGEITALTTPSLTLVDANSAASQQPPSARNPWRGLSQDYFVFIPFAPPRGCRVRAEFPPTPTFLDTCSGARYDLAGRVLSLNGQAQLKNLPVPPYRISTTGALEVAVWQPGVP